MTDDEAVFGYDLDGDELRRLIVLPADQRLTYFIEKCAETGQVWTIGVDEELVVLADDGAAGRGGVRP